MNWNKFESKNQYELSKVELSFRITARELKIPDSAGIYLWTRTENDKTFWYIGQAKSLQNRFAQYQMIIYGYNKRDTRHFALSLRTHKDWMFKILHKCSEFELDTYEKKFIDEYLQKENWETRNEQKGGSDHSLISPNDYKKQQRALKKQNANIKYLERMIKKYKHITKIDLKDFWDFCINDA